MGKTCIISFFLILLLFAACSDTGNMPEDNDDNNNKEQAELFFKPGTEIFLEDNSGNSLEITIKDSSQMLWVNAFWDTTNKKLRNTHEIKVKQMTGNFPEYHTFGFVQNGSEIIFGAQRHPLFQTNYYVDYFIEYFRFEVDQKDTTIINKFKNDQKNTIYKDSILIFNEQYSMPDTTVSAMKIKHISSINNSSGSSHAEENYVFSKHSSILEFWNYTKKTIF